MLKVDRNEGKEDIELLGEAGADEEDDEDAMRLRMQVNICINILLFD